MTFHFMENGSGWCTAICYTDPNKTSPKEIQTKMAIKLFFFLQLANCQRILDTPCPSPSSFFKYSVSKQVTDIPNREGKVYQLDCMFFYILHKRISFTLLCYL